MLNKAKQLMQPAATCLSMYCVTVILLCHCTQSQVKLSAATWLSALTSFKQRLCPFNFFFTLRQAVQPPLASYDVYTHTHVHTRTKKAISFRV